MSEKVLLSPIFERPEEDYVITERQFCVDGTGFGVIFSDNKTGDIRVRFEDVDAEVVYTLEEGHFESISESEVRAPEIASVIVRNAIAEAKNPDNDFRKIDQTIVV